MTTVRLIGGALLFGFLVGCGGGGSSCPGDAPLECTTGGCCPRGYPYSCGNGLCYQTGCPVGSPEIGICDLKLAQIDENEVAAAVSSIDGPETELCVPESEPIND